MPRLYVSKPESGRYCLTDLMMHPILGLTPSLAPGPLWPQAYFEQRHILAQGILRPQYRVSQCKMTKIKSSLRWIQVTLENIYGG